MSNTAAHDDLEIEILDQSQDFIALRGEWDALCVRAETPHFFHGFDWCWRIWQHVARVRDRRLRLVIGRIEGRLVLVWPLMLAGRVLRMLSSDTLEYRDIIVEHDANALEWMRKAWRAATQDCGADLFLLQNALVPSNLERVMRHAPDSHAVGGGASHVLRLSRHADWDAYARRLPKSMLGDQRRQWRRASEATSGLVFEVLQDTGRIAGTIDWIVDRKLDWLNAKGRSNELFGTPEIRALFRDGALAAHRAGRLICARLGNSDTTLSAGFGYHFRDQFLFHVFAYDLTHAKVSPSRLFLESLIRTCKDRGVSTFDFMPGDEAYKMTWCDDVIHSKSFAGPLSMRGRVLWWWHTHAVGRIRMPTPARVAIGILPLSLRRELRRKLTDAGLMGIATSLVRPRFP